MELSSDRRPGTEQNTSEGEATPEMTMSLLLSGLRMAATSDSITQSAQHSHTHSLRLLDLFKIKQLRPTLLKLFEDYFSNVEWHNLFQLLMANKYFFLPIKVRVNILIRPCMQVIIFINFKINSSFKHLTFYFILKQIKNKKTPSIPPTKKQLTK